MFFLISATCINLLCNSYNNGKNYSYFSFITVKSTKSLVVKIYIYCYFFFHSIGTS